MVIATRWPEFRPIPTQPIEFFSVRCFRPSTGNEKSMVWPSVTL